MQARRSLRLWPISGSVLADVWESTRDFLYKLLGLGSIGEDQIENIARPERQSGFGVKDEAIVLFKFAETRDSVIGASSKLSNMIDTNNKPTAGIRIEVPRGLRPTFNILRRYGHQLKMRHGTRTRHYVKFDNAMMTIFLNVRLPGRRGGQELSQTLQGGDCKSGRGSRVRKWRTCLTLEVSVPPCQGQH